MKTNITISKTKRKQYMYTNRKFLPRFIVKSMDNFVLLALPSIKYFDLRGEAYCCITESGGKYIIDSDRKSLCSIHWLGDFIWIDIQLLINPSHVRQVVDKGDRWVIQFNDNERCNVMKIKNNAPDVYCINPIMAYY